MENPDLVLQETGSRPTYSRLNYVPSGDTLRRDAISSYHIETQEHKKRKAFFMPGEPSPLVSYPLYCDG